MTTPAANTTPNSSGTGAPPPGGAPPATEGNGTAGTPPQTPPATTTQDAKTGEPGKAEGTLLGTDPTPSTDTGKQDGAPGAEQKDGKPKEGESADIELKLPDGFKADDDLLKGFKAEAKAAGLKSDNAQKLFDLYVKAQAQLAEKSKAAAEAKHGEWVKQAQADKEFGGTAFQENLKQANQAFQKFATPELRELYKSTNLASHPEVVRHFYRLAKADAEGTAAGPAGAPTPENSREAFYKGLYPNTKFGR